MIWLAVLGAAAGCYLLKLAGVSLPAPALDREWVRRLAGLLPFALLAALVAVGTFDAAGRLVVDARLAGVAAGAVVVALRAPFVAVLVVAAGTAAAVRAVA